MAAKQEERMPFGEVTLKEQHNVNTASSEFVDNNHTLTQYERPAWCTMIHANMPYIRNHINNVDTVALRLYKESVIPESTCNSIVQNITRNGPTRAAEELIEFLYRNPEESHHTTFYMILEENGQTKLAQTLKKKNAEAIRERTNVTRIKDLHDLKQDSNCSVTATVTYTSEVQVSSTNKKYVKMLIQDGDATEDSITLHVYKKDMWKATTGEAYTFGNAIYNGSFLILTYKSQAVKTSMKSIIPLQEKIRDLHAGAHNHEVSVISGRIVQVSPKRSTKRQSLQYLRLKDKASTIKEITVWGQTIPDEGLISISHLLSSQMTDFSTSRRSVVTVVQEDNGEVPAVDEADIITSDHFPGKKEGSLGSVSEVFSYMACSTCKTKRVAETCLKCDQIGEYVTNFVAKVMIMQESELVEYTIFHDDLMDLLGTTDRQDNVECRLKDLIGQRLCFFANNKTITNVRVK